MGNHDLIQCNGRLLDLGQPLVMGVINATPDSFYDGGHHNRVDTALMKVDEMLEDGASIIDIGGMSSRPGAEVVTIAEEKQRVLPIIRKIVKKHTDVIISIDTIHAEVARAAISEGASIINDISAGKMDERMYPTVAELKVPYILMHMKGTPKDMQDAPRYENILDEVLSFMIQEVSTLRRMGVKDIILDTGFGFGKTIDHNYELLSRMSDFQILDIPILAGISRKSMIYKYLGITADQALNGTTALNMVALQQGAKILRVHDVREAVQCIKLFDKCVAMKG